MRKEPALRGCFEKQARHHRFGETDLVRATHNLPQNVELLTLLIDQQLRVTNDVDKQDMPDLEFYFCGMLGRHGLSSIWKSGS
jgi:hypothetical protein